MVELYTLMTRTPLWTGDILGHSKQVRETGIIGSLRWWYEAIVRGLGGYACDPSQGSKCEWDPARKEKSLCPACYLFGATGWARLFSLRMGSLSTVPIFFRHLSKANDSWMNLIFKKQLPSQKALWGKTTLSLRDRGVDVGYALQQAKLALAFAALYGGIGARTQHGFGQVCLSPPLGASDNFFAEALRALKQRIDAGEFRRGANPHNAPNLTQFVYLMQIVDPGNRLIKYYTQIEPFPGTPEVRVVDQLQYLPCAFELRYQATEFFERRDGSRKDLRKVREDLSFIGFRRWIKEHSRDNWTWRELTDLLGRTPRHGERQIPDKERQGSHVSFAMPFKIRGGYAFKVFGCAPDGKTEQLKADLRAYISALLGVPSDCWSGDEWLAQYVGGAP